MYRFLVAWPLMVTIPVAIVCSGAANGQVREQPSLEEHRQARKELAQRRRRIIMNNDGCDVLYFPQNEKATVEAFLAKRTTPLADTQALAHGSQKPDANALRLIV